MNISFSTPRDSLEPDSGVSTMGGARPGCQWEGFNLTSAPKPGSQAWSSRGSISSSPQIPMGHVGGTDVPT